MIEESGCETTKLISLLKMVLRISAHRTAGANPPPTAGTIALEAWIRDDLGWQIRGNWCLRNLSQSTFGPD